MICSQLTALEETIGVIKILVEDHLSGHKDSLLKIGDSQVKDLEWKHQQFPMALMISTALVLLTLGLMASFLIMDGS